MKVLMIGAHQDDNEFRCGALAHKYVQLGHTVRFLSMTHGNGGHHILSNEETVARRAKESKAVQEFLGIEYDIWPLADCEIMPDLENRQKLIRYAEAFEVCDYGKPLTEELKKEFFPF